MSKKKNRAKVRKSAGTTARKSSPEWHSLWERQSLVRQHTISFILLLILSISFFAPIHFSDLQLVAGDTVSWRGMAQSMIEFEEETGETALWAGRTFAGMPGYMISPELSVPQVDSIMRQLRLLFWPTSHMMLLFMGTYFLAFFLTRNAFSGLFASVAFGLTTYIPVILIAGHNSKFVALAWAPWMLLAFAYVMKKKSVSSGLLFAVALAANLRAGHVQITYYVTIAAGIWWLFEAVSAIRSGKTHAFLRSTGMLTLGSVLGLMMVAEPYLAHAEVKPHTIRGAASGGAPGGMAWEYAMGWSQGWAELWTLVLSKTFGGGSPTYWGDKIFTAGPHHLGVISIGFAVLVLWKKRDRLTQVLATGSILMILFSLGQNLEVLNKFMFNYFPLFDAFRVPETWLSIVALLVALMAARGILVLGPTESDTVKFTSLSHVRVFMGMSVLVIAMMTVGASFMTFEKPFEQEQVYSQVQSQYPSAEPAQIEGVVRQEVARRMVDREDGFQADATRAIVFLLLVLIVFFLLYRKSIPLWMASLVLVLLMAIDLSGVGRDYLNESVLSPGTSVEDRVPEYAYDSFIKNEADANGGDGSFRVLSFEFGQSPGTNARPSFHYESLGGYSGAKLRLFQDFLDELIFNPAGNGLNQGILDMLNVRFIVAGGGVPGFMPVFQDEQTGMAVLESQSYLERAYLVDRLHREDSVDALWDRLQSTEFDPSQQALVLEMDEEVINRLSGPADSTNGSGVEVELYNAQDMTFNVTSSRPRLLVVSEIYYAPGWKARVNGVETPIYQTNYLLRGIEIPAGESTVQLSFEPASYSYGRMVTGAGTLITYGFLGFFSFLAFRRRRRDVVDSSEEDLQAN